MRAKSRWPQRIRKQLSEMDSAIVNNAVGSSSLFNNYAWLAVKTNRHLDKAFAYAKEAVDVNPASAADIDTLAHVYAAQGNFDKAIELQQLSVSLEPASQNLYKSLLHFKELKEKE